MNILLSLLIYNPLEAYTLILLCDIITGNNTRFNKNNLITLWEFGAVNFIIQYIPNIIYGFSTYVYLTLFFNYLIIPISLLFFYRGLSGNVKYWNCLVCQMINCLFIIVVSNIFNTFIYSYNIFCPANRFHELFSNFVIFFVQILLYTSIKHRRFHYEKRFQRNCK